MFELDRMPKADDLGFFIHPDVPNLESMLLIREALATAGYYICQDTAEDDLYYEKSFEYDPIKSNAWKPVPDEGCGWLLVAVYDTEDGPWALFVRPRTR